MAKFQVIREKTVQFYQKTLVWCLRHNIGGRTLAVLAILLIIAVSVIAGWTAVYTFISVLFIMGSSELAAGIVLMLISGVTTWFVAEWLIDKYDDTIVNMWHGVKPSVA